MTGETTSARVDAGSVEELAAWLRLLETPGVGRTTARKLLAALGSPEAIFHAPPDALRSLVGLKLAGALGRPPAGLAQLLSTTLDWLARDDHSGGERAVLTLGDPRYPARLLELPDPPLLLYAHGRLDRLACPALAVVGSRHPSAQGAENARVFSCALSQAGLTVVSGLALGIDSAAHEGALLGAGSTIAVIGTGLDRVYPRRHLDLAHRIAATGLLLSEFPLGTAPLAANFPQRNRIIAGLSLGALVVEATLQSGSLITARLAAEQGREVFAIPGSIHSPQSRGCHALIRQGAKLVETTGDILEELRLSAPGTAQAGVESISPIQTQDVAIRSGSARPARSTTGPLPETEVDRSDLLPGAGPLDPILQALDFGPATLDALQVRTGWATSELTVHLLNLELSGDVERLPGQLFQRAALA